MSPVPNACIYPQIFCRCDPSPAAADYLADPAVGKLAEFFRAKGLPALKHEDRNEAWYPDWIDYQSRHRLYASLLSPQSQSTRGGHFNLLRLTRFLEVFAYFSPAHGYSLQVTFLGLFPILMGDNEQLKTQAVAALEAGGLFALGVSEKDHGADLMATQFAIRPDGNGGHIANGSKYYIGNSNTASIVSILARRIEDPARARRAPFVLLAVRPHEASGYRDIGKIRTLGIRAAHVGELEVKEHALGSADFIADGRRAWDAVLGTVTLGKFFLGFGSIGICEHAMAEAAAHLGQRILYNAPASAMPHLRAAMNLAWVRLLAMKLYAYRALDYVQAASAADRRYLLYCAVQKAKVSTEGVKVMALLSECVGAKGFETDTYFEMALRDIQLIPGLEGSAHINLVTAAQFLPRYFASPDPATPSPPSCSAGQATASENPYLFDARTGAINTIAFAHFLAAYQPLREIPNLRRFIRQARAFRQFLTASADLPPAPPGDTQHAILHGQCLAIIAYGQLIAENALLLSIDPPLISAIFHALIGDLSAAALSLAALPGASASTRANLRRIVTTPRTSQSDWDSISALAAPAAFPSPG